ncbi:hypothetical protein [Spiroplasma endosymbiont of Labia minor]|uniref:hypothetical protein n=1 Tax=Spiroplasma endosymbiont of Labia minor TaxID=3066305 RepID=UPI0030CF4DDD
MRSINLKYNGKSTELNIKIIAKELDDGIYFDFENEEKLIEFKSKLIDNLVKCDYKIYNKNIRELAKKLELEIVTKKCEERIEEAVKEFKQKLDLYEKALEKLGVNINDLAKEHSNDLNTEMEFD